MRTRRNPRVIDAAHVIEHAEATTVRVELGEVGDELALVVEDDGHGFNPKQLASRLADGHVGLASQRVRIEAAGGSMSVASGPGRGTRVEIRVPNRQ
jgi:two-component system, NarL family, sensor kinase